MNLEIEPEALSGASLAAEEPQLLHHFFERIAARYPNRLALDVPPDSGRTQRRELTYRELDRQANAVAATLGTCVAGECVVALLFARDNTELYAAQLGTLKAGAAYCCIDAAFPEDQLKYILADSGAVALLTDAAGAERAAQCGFERERTFIVADLTRTPTAARAQPAWLTPQNLAYVIYTSGTTGRPKGVMIEHGSIANLVAYDIETFGLTSEDRISQNSSPAYDSSVEEIWFAFAVGATLVVMDEQTARLGPDLVPWLRRERITLLCPPPTLLRTLSAENPAALLPDLKFVYVGGEALPRDVADRWSAGLRLENGYGPTECTVTTSHTRIHPDATITIGKPISGLQAWVLNEALEEVPYGEQGELCVSGIGLARGYLNQPELTAQKFPTLARIGRIYRTGDLVSLTDNGELLYHGRIDTQVKLRGYRVELEEIETRIAEFPGVREAACRVQTEGAQQTLAAFLVLEQGCAEISFDDLKMMLRAALPSYMVPSRFALLEALPRTVGGKMARKLLPVLAAPSRADREIITPRNPVETQLVATVRATLRLSDEISVYDDFFHDLGGDSLNAAMLVSRLRDDAVTAALTVRDLYETRTVAGLAERLQHANAAQATHANARLIAKAQQEQQAGRPMRAVLATVCQTLWLALGLVLGSVLTYLTAFELTPRLFERLGLIPFLLASPFIFFGGLVLYAPLAVLLTALVKRVLIGTYRPRRAPVWGSFYVRNWMVQQTARLVPWEWLKGTVFHLQALRLLGARIGQRVHIHRGVQLFHGGWDLLEIGDDAMLGQDVSLRLVDLDDGEIIVGAIKIGAGCTLETRAGLDANTTLEPGAWLTASSSLPAGGRIPAGQRWDGIPAQPAGRAPQPPAVDTSRDLSPFWHSVCLVLARAGLGLLLALPLELPFFVLALRYGVDADDARNWLFHPALSLAAVTLVLLVLIFAQPVTLWLEALALRAIGPVRPGVISRWSPDYIRVLLKSETVMSASDWLSGTLFWPMWLRQAGMVIGFGCEISTIFDVVPELIEIGSETFFADGIYLGGALLCGGTVTLAQTRLGNNTFLGNHAIIPGGQQLPDDILLGVCTVADDRQVRPGTSWFGLPPFELPRREIVECDRALTHEPTFIRYWNRVFWELLRFALPILPLLALPFWCELLAQAHDALAFPAFLFGAVPLATLALSCFFALTVLALKWLLLGRVKPGQHPLYSCWCSRWDFLFVAWAFYARAGLMALEGTLLLNWYLRAMGCHIGRNVVLGTGHSQVVDPDMLHFEDGTTVNCQFQAHTFEDRVLKIDHVYIRAHSTVAHNACLLYGADIGAQAHVAPHSVVMKREVLLPGRAYEGFPTHSAGL